jgi:hypothetical protein
MKPHLSCREATRLVIEREDRRLRLSERLGLRLHMLVCKACPSFVHQVQFMHGAVGRWRRHAEGEDEPRA